MGKEVIICLRKTEPGPAEKGPTQEGAVDDATPTAARLQNRARAAEVPARVRDEEAAAGAAVEAAAPDRAEAEGRRFS